MSQIAALPKFEVPIVVGNVNSKFWYFFFTAVSQLLIEGETATVPLAKLTTAGTNGSLTFTNGVLTAFTAPT